VFDIAFSELVVVALVALIVLGPKRLPEVARTAGRWAARLRRFIDDTRREIDREIKDADLAALKEVHREIVETRDLLGTSAGDFAVGLNEPYKEEPPKILSATDTPAGAPETPVKPRKSKQSAGLKTHSKKKRARQAAPRKPHVRRKSRTR